MEIVNEQRKKIHPHKFTLWVALGSIIMMFAGLTSAYVVKRDQPGWTTFPIPRAFWYSTAVILISSLTIQLSLKAFKEREISRYRSMLTLTAVLGILFVVLQYVGFKQIWETGITLHGSGGGSWEMWCSIRRSRSSRVCTSMRIAGGEIPARWCCS